MYAFQASEPDSRPPPLSFSPPKAPPISAPEVPRLMLAIPQSLPAADRNASAFCSRSVNSAEDRSEEHTSELQSQSNLVCRLLLEKKKKAQQQSNNHLSQKQSIPDNVDHDDCVFTIP